MMIKPIKTNDDYNAAIARIDALWNATEGTPEHDELGVLVTLADAWEEKHFPIDLPDPVEAIKFRMEQLGLTRKDMEPYLGSRARVSEILNRKRDLSLAMIRTLHRELNIPAECLIGHL
jgi:HTH-type transcriptional regulator/antitoxin HigA